jgi:hypothetical protein
MASGYTFPLDCWVGLQVSGTEVSAAGYVRLPATFVDMGEGIAANEVTIQWPECLANWGPIDTANLYDAATGGHLIGTGLTASVVQAQRYDRLRIPSGGYQVYRATRPLGFGTLTWGVARYATWNYLTPPGSGIGSPYGVVPYGAGPYEAMELGVLVLKTFGLVQLCQGQPADWAPAGPYSVTA